MGNETTTGRSSPPRVIIHIIRGKATSASREMKGRSLLIGSGPQCDIQMRSPGVAPKHAILTRGPDCVLIQSLDSDHPIAVNDSIVGYGFVADGDVIRVGPFELKISIDAALNATSLGFDEPTILPARDAGGDPPASISPPGRDLRLSLQQAMKRLAGLTSGASPDFGQTRHHSSPVVGIQSAATHRPEYGPHLRPDPMARDRDLERRMREVQEQLAQIESDRRTLHQERGRIETHRLEIDRREQDIVRRESELINKTAEIDRRELAMRDAERRLDESQIALTERSIRLDRVAEALEARRSRVGKVRRRLFQLYRIRRQAIETIEREWTQRMSMLESERADQEAAVAQCRRVADELGERQAELKRLDTDVKRRLDMVHRREQDLEDRKRKFEKEIVDVKEKAKSIESFQLDLDRRAARIAQEEDSLRAARRSIEEQLELVRRQSAEIQKHYQELEAQRRASDKIAEELREQEAAIERERARLTRGEVAPAAGDSPTSDSRGSTVSLAGRLAEHVALRRELVDFRQEVEKLRALMNDVGERQRRLIERELSWSEDLRVRHGQLSRIAAEARRRQASLHDRPDLRGRKVQKLRDLAARLFGQGAADSQSDLGKRRMMAAQRIEAQERVEVARSGDEAASRQTILDSIVAELNRVDDERQASDETRVIIESDSKRMEKLRSAVDELLAKVTPEPGVSEATTTTSRESMNQLVQALCGWEDHLVHARQTVELRGRELDEKQQSALDDQNRIAHFAQSVGVDLDATGRMDASAEVVAKAPDRSPAFDVGMTDEELSACIVSSGLLDESRLQYFLQSAAGRRTSLAEELLRSNALTPYQLHAVAGKGPWELRLGTAPILDILHVGAVATTYFIASQAGGGPVVARMLRPQWSRDPAQRRQHEIVIESLRDFRHPNIVATLGALIAGDRFGSITEYVESASLLELQDYCLPPPVIVSVCRQAVVAVAAAERAGFVHQNIRPSRLLVTPAGDLRVLGYGEPSWLSKIHRCEKGRSIAAFVAPEISAPGSTPDARADLYSIGQICQRIATNGRRTVNSHEPAVSAEYPEAFLRLLAAMVAPSPANRPSPAEALAVLEPMSDPSAFAVWPDLALLFDARNDPFRGRRAA